MRSPCRSLNSDTSFITKFSLVMKANGAEKVADLEPSLHPARRHGESRCSWFLVPLIIQGMTALRGGHTGSRVYDDWNRGFRCFGLVRRSAKLSSRHLPPCASLLVFSFQSATSNNSPFDYRTREGLLLLLPNSSSPNPSSTGDSSKLPTKIWAAGAW